MLWTERLGLLNRRRATTKADRRSRTNRLLLDSLEPRVVLNAACPTISGYVYHDLNNNGLYDTNERVPANAIAGSKIELYRGNTLVASTVTDANGYYEFNLDTSRTVTKTVTYTATVDLATTNWSKELALPQFDPSLGTLTGVTVTHGGQIQTVFGMENKDAGPRTGTLAASGALTLSNIPGSPNLVVPLGPVSVTFDATGFDGSKNFAGTSGKTFDPVSSGWHSTSIDITDEAVWDASYIGTGIIKPFDSAVAASDMSGAGNFMTMIETQAQAEATVTYEYLTYDCLAPGDYDIKQAVQPNGFLDGQETRGNESPIPNSGGGPDSIPITLGTEDLPDNNFGEIVGAALGDFVWKDLDRDGLQDSGEPGIQGVTVTLTGTDDLGAVTRTLNTDASGNYRFNDLRPGTYQVTFGAVSGLSRTLANVGNNDTLDSDADPTTGKTGDYNLAQGDVNLTVDAGYVTKKSDCDPPKPPPPCDPPKPPKCDPPKNDSPKDNCGPGGWHDRDKDNDKDHDKNNDKDCDRDRDRGGNGGWGDKNNDKDCDRDRDRDRGGNGGRDNKDRGGYGGGKRC